MQPQILHAPICEPLRQASKMIGQQFRRLAQMDENVAVPNIALNWATSCAGALPSKTGCTSS
jgi:hypothetical protein